MRPNILICGFGAFGQQHAIAWRTISPQARLLVADVDPNARARARKMGLEAGDIFENYDDLISRADIVDIVTTSESHYSLAARSLVRKIPTIIEKPAVRYLKEAKKLAELAKIHNVPVQVQFVLRAHPLVIEAKKLIESGEIGRLLAMDGVFTGWKRMRPDASILENDGVHMLDLMQFLSGSKPRNFEVSGDRLLGGNVPETVHLRLNYPKKIKGYLRLGIMFGGKKLDPYLVGSLTKKTLTLIGDRGSIEIDFNDDTMEVTEITYTKTAGGFTPTVGCINIKKCANITPVVLLVESFKQFLTAIKKQSEVMCDLKEGAVQITKLLDQAREKLKD